MSLVIFSLYGDNESYSEDGGSGFSLKHEEPNAELHGDAPHPGHNTLN